MVTLSFVLALGVAHQLLSVVEIVLAAMIFSSATVQWLAAIASISGTIMFFVVADCAEVALT